MKLAVVKEIKLELINIFIEEHIFMSVIQIISNKF